ncbi:MAG: TetR/AcrR family transcriptional regulator [Ilumatobacter sp.]
MVDSGTTEPRTVEEGTVEAGTEETRTASTEAANSAASSGGRSSSQPARRGRPRSVEADEAILSATLELAGEVGIDGMSMDDLAARAGVSKATVYRRWPSKETLVIAALDSAIVPFDDVDTGSLRADLDMYLGELVQRFDKNPMSDILPHLIEASRRDEAVRSSLDDYVRHRRAPLRSLLERAVVRGELAGHLDLDVLIDVLIGPFVYRRLLTRDPIDQGFVDRLLSIVLPER